MGAPCATLPTGWATRASSTPVLHCLSHAVQKVVKSFTIFVIGSVDVTHICRHFRPCNGLTEFGLRVTFLHQVCNVGIGVSHLGFFHTDSMAHLTAFCKRVCGSLPSGTRPGSVVHLYYLQLVIHRSKCGLASAHSTTHGQSQRRAQNTSQPYPNTNHRC